MVPVEEDIPERKVAQSIDDYVPGTFIKLTKKQFGLIPSGVHKKYSFGRVIKLTVLEEAGLIDMYSAIPGLYQLCQESFDDPERIFYETVNEDTRYSSFKFDPKSIEDMPRIITKEEVESGLRGGRLNSDEQKIVNSWRNGTVAVRTSYRYHDIESFK